MLLPSILLLVASAPTTIDLGPLPLELEADVFRAEPKLGVFIAEGHAVLRRQGLSLFADRLFLDRNSGLVTAEGHVVAVEGSSVLSCERVVLRIPDLDGAIENAHLVLKRGRARTGSAAEALSYGDDLMRLDALRIERTGPREFSVEDATFTPCRCAPGTSPDWSLGASSADVDVDSGALLYWPVIYVKDVPVLALPVFYVPLGERRTGLLLPRAGYAATSGFQATLPFYVTLGRSFDLTLDSSVWIDRGPVPALEMRWAPVPGHEGELRTTVLLDLGVLGANGRWSMIDDRVLPRFAITGHHRGRTDDLTVAADLNVAGDLAYISEFGFELFERQAEEAVSRVTIAHDFGAHMRVSGGVALRQDLRLVSYGMFSEARRVELFDPQYDVEYRFAELRLDALPYPLLGGPWSPLGSARLKIDTISRLELGDRTIGRVDFRPALTLPFGTHGLSLVGEAALRLTAASGDSSEGRIAPMFATVATAELHGVLGDVTHVIRPRVTHLAIPVVEGRPILGAADEIGYLTVAHDLRFELENELFLKGAARRVAWLDAAFDQDLRERDNRLVLLRALIDLPLQDLAWSATLGARSEIDLSPDPRLAELRFTATLARANVGSLAVTFAELDDIAPRASRIDPEHLTPSLDPLDGLWTAFRGVVASIGANPIAPLRLDLSVQIDALADEPLRLIRGQARWTSPCECWSASVKVSKARDRDVPDFQVAFDLAQVGGTGF